jgi:hypothetical protein
MVLLHVSSELTRLLVVLLARRNRAAEFSELQSEVLKGAYPGIVELFFDFENISQNTNLILLFELT